MFSHYAGKKSDQTLTLVIRCMFLYNMGEGTHYPALKRLENKEWIESYWDSSDTPGGRRKYYRITEKGTVELSRKLTEWRKLSFVIQEIAGGSL